MPMPVSRTTALQRTRGSRPGTDSARTVRSTRPRSVNLMALPSRLSKICRTRVASASTHGVPPSSIDRPSSIPLRSAWGCNQRCTWRTSSGRSTGSGWMRSWPASSADRSRMSLSSASRCPADARAVCRRSRWAGVSGLSASRSSMPSMPLNGVRSSWLMLARNWLLIRLAACASSRARAKAVLRASSALRSWVCRRCRCHSARAANSSTSTWAAISQMT